MNKDTLKKIFETLTPGISDAFQDYKARRYVKKNQGALNDMVQRFINEHEHDMRHISVSDLMDIDPTDAYEPTIFDIDSDN